MPKKQRKPGWIVLQPWVTLFLDLLGWSREVMEFEKVPLVRQDAGKVKDILRGPLLRHRIARKTIRTLLFEEMKFLDGPEWETQVRALPLDQQALITRRATPRLVVNTFGDSFVVNLPCPRDDEFGFKVALTHIWILMQRAAGAFALLLSAGIPVRGAMELGMTVECDPEDGGAPEVVGPSQVLAYKLESQQAGHIRVMVGPNLVGLARDLNFGRVQGADDPQTRLFAKSVLDLVWKEPNGSYSLDYLAPSVCGQGKAVSPDAVEEARQFLATSLKAAEDGKNDELLAKYQPALAYFAARSP